LTWVFHKAQDRLGSFIFGITLKVKDRVGFTRRSIGSLASAVMQADLHCSVERSLGVWVTEWLFSLGSRHHRYEDDHGLHPPNITLSSSHRFTPFSGSCRKYWHVAQALVAL
jgi:hypothetical protein